jgi:hypothetical protein
VNDIEPQEEVRQRDVLKMGKNLQKMLFGEFATFLMKETKGKERNSISF